ncbi:MAG: hypothetical protein KDE27_02825, partial [Planctomycetes bacterium]|nr:hypothetical protein [Planctomycetota bacterium]
MKAELTPPVVAGQRTGQVRERGYAHIWIPAGAALRPSTALLLGDVLDIADVHGTGYPNSPTFISKRWGTSRPTARKDRDELIDLGYVEIRINDGVETLIPTAKTRDLVFYPLARSLLRGRGKRPRPAVLMAAAALLADTIGPRADRRGIRTDTERADAVGVSRSTIIEARNMLVNRGMIEVQIEFRGREKAIRLVRVVAARDARGNPMSSHGSPPSEERLDVAGQRAQRGRARLHGGGKSSDSGRGKPADHPCVAPRGSVPMQAPPAPRDGAAGRLEQDGSDRQQQPDRRPDRAVSPTPPPRGEPIAIAEGLADL